MAGVAHTSTLSYHVDNWFIIIIKHHVVLPKVSGEYVEAGLGVCCCRNPNLCTVTPTFLQE